MIEKLERVPVGEIWKTEPHDFTPWLQENIDVLNEALGLSLQSAEREQAAGSFNVDLVAEDESRGLAVIENQLGQSDHDHLGKLITYLTAIDAKIGIWIVTDPRPEHVGAVAWLNQSSSASFYLVKLEAVRIGDSPAAALLTLITGPSEETREIGWTKQELADREIRRQQFWQELLDRARQRTKLHAAVSPSTANWVSAGAGKSGFSYAYVVTQHDATVELLIDRGKGREADTGQAFEALRQNRGQIETAFGEPLDWSRNEARRACYIRWRTEIGGYRDEDSWARLQDAMIDAMIRLEKALKPFIAKLDV